MCEHGAKGAAGPQEHAVIASNLLLAVIKAVILKYVFRLGPNQMSLFFICLLVTSSCLSKILLLSHCR